MSARLTERQQMKLLQEEAKAAEEGTTSREETQPKQEPKSKSKSRIKSRKAEKDEEMESSRTSSPSLIGGWTIATTETKASVKVLVIPPAPDADTNDMADVFNVEDSSDEEEVVSSRSRRRVKRKRPSSSEEEEGSGDEKATATKEKEAAPAKSEGGIPRLKKKALVSEDTKADLQYISKTSLLSKSTLPPTTAAGTQQVSSSTPAFPAGSGYRSGPKRPETQPTQRAPIPSSVRPASSGSTGPPPVTRPPASQRPPMPPDALQQHLQPPMQTRGRTDTERRILKGLERLVSEVMGSDQAFARKESGGAIDMSGSFLHDEENRFDFYDIDANGEIVYQPKIPIFPEDFPPCKREWPLSWWGIVDPALAPESKSPVPEEGRNPGSGGPPPHEGWNRSGPPPYPQQGPHWPHGGGGRGWAPGAGRGGWDGAWRGGRGGGPPPWARDGRRPDERRPPGPGLGR